MNPMQDQPDIQLHPEEKSVVHGYAYKWVWGASGVILLLAVVLTLMIWLWGNDEVGEVIPEVIPWTAEDKMEALEELNSTAQRQGVPQLTAEEKLRILENASKTQ